MRNYNLLDFEKTILFDTLCQIAQWVPVGTKAGYWRINLWSSSEDIPIQTAIVEEHHRIHGEKV